MPAITRREAREQILQLLFETEFQTEKAPQDIYQLAVESRDLTEDDYMNAVYFGVLENQQAIDEKIAKYAKGWSVGRIAPVTRNILRIAVYEMCMRQDIPARVAINEAIELTKKYDDDKAKAFVNGILNSVKDELTNKEA